MTILPQDHLAAGTNLPFEDAELLHHAIQQADHRVHGRAAAEGLLQLCHHHGDVACLTVNVLLRSSEAFVQRLVGHLEEREEAEGWAGPRAALP